MSIASLVHRGLGVVPLLARAPHADRVVLVTGASSGIGEAVALHAARRGSHLVVVARGEDSLHEVAQRCLDAGAASATVEVCDVSDDESVAGLVERVAARHGRLDAVVHSAGVVTYGRVEETRAEDFASVVGTNLLGAASVARHVVPVLRKQDAGDLVLVGSLLGSIAVPEMTPYVVSKWGVRALARQLHIENLDSGLRVHHVSPGSVDTPIYDRALDDAGGVNAPPPPTIPPEQVARVVWARITRRRLLPALEAQTSVTNYVLLGAFRAAPRLWDHVAGPAFEVASRRRGG